MNESNMKVRQLMTTIAKACPPSHHRLITMQGSHQLMQAIEGYHLATGTHHRFMTTTQARHLTKAIEGLRGQSCQLADTLKAISPPRHDMTTITRSFRECVKLMNDESE